MATKYLASATYLGFNGAHGELERLNVCRMKHMVNALYSDAMRLIYQKNYTRAFEVLTALDRFSHPKALYTLGCLYEFGIGTPRSDRSTAAKYYAAARAGSTMFRGFTDADSKYKRTVLRMLSK